MKNKSVILFIAMLGLVVSVPLIFTYNRYTVKGNVLTKTTQSYNKKA